MGTNYYFEIKDYNEIINNIKEISQFISDETLQRIQRELADIHIGKRSTGWKPLFAKTCYYSTMDELKSFYTANKENLIIKTEYNTVITWEELEDELINWNGKPNTKFDSNYYSDKDGFDWLKGEFC